MSVPLPRVEPGELDGPSDAHLIAAVRAGDGDAFGHLYRRHVAAAHNLARQLTRSTAERDDLVAEAFAKVLDTMRAGGGPDIAFRAYLLTTLRNTLYDRIRRDRRLELSDDMTRHDPGEPWVDTAVADFETTMAARAFARLPERWQTVLWHTEVEQETPAQVAPVLGLSANGVAALAYRAREGLRQAYLQEHLADADGKECRHTVERLGAWARGGLSRRSRAQVDGHLESCAQCRLLAGELADVNSSLRGLIAPAVLGGGALVAAYLAAATPEAAAAAAAGAAGAAGGAAASSAGGAAAGAGSSAAAGGAAAGSGAAAGAGGAAAGGGAAGAAGGAAAGAGAAASTGGSLLGTAAGWVVGTQVGQASAAAVAAVVIGGATVVGLNTGPGTATSAADPVVTSAPASPGPRAPGESVVGPPAGGQVTPGAPGRSGTPGPAGPGAASGPGGPPAGRGTGRPSAPGNSGAGGPAGAPVPPALPGGGPPGGPAGGPAGPPAIEVDRPAPVRPLRAGDPGEISISVRNTGTGAATDLVAVVSLPPGFTVRAGGSSSPSEWACTGTADVATCRATRIPAGGRGTVRVKVRLTGTAGAGPVSGQVSVAGTDPTPIPTTTVPVTPR